MFTKQPDINAIGLKMAIDKLFADLSNATAGTEEHAAIVAQIDVLYKLREVDSNVNCKKRVSPDAWAAAAVNLIGILLIVGYEQKRVITTKALSLITKLK